MADVESKSIPHELPSSHWLKATGQCVLERYLSATMFGFQLKWKELLTRGVPALIIIICIIIIIIRVSPKNSIIIRLILAKANIILVSANLFKVQFYELNLVSVSLLCQKLSGGIS